METTITLPRLGALRAYWAKVPPISVLMAARYGLKGAEPKGEVIRGKKLFDMIMAAGGKIKNVGLSG